MEGGKDVTELSERGRWLSSPYSYLNGAADRPISYLIKQAQGVRGVCVMFLSGAWSHLWQDRSLASTQEEAETSQRMSHDFRPTDVLRDGDLQWNTDEQSIVFEIRIPHMYHIFTYFYTFAINFFLSMALVREKIKHLKYSSMGSLCCSLEATAHRVAKQCLEAKKSVLCFSSESRDE